MRHFPRNCWNSSRQSRAGIPPFRTLLRRSAEFTPQQTLKSRTVSLKNSIVFLRAVDFLTSLDSPSSNAYILGSMSNSVCSLIELHSIEPRQTRYEVKRKLLGTSRYWLYSSANSPAGPAMTGGNSSGLYSSFSSLKSSCSRSQFAFSIASCFVNPWSRYHCLCSSTLARKTSFGISRSGSNGFCPVPILDQSINLVAGTVDLGEFERQLKTLRPLSGMMLFALLRLPPALYHPHDPCKHVSYMYWPAHLSPSSEFVTPYTFASFALPRSVTGRPFPSSMALRRGCGICVIRATSSCFSPLVIRSCLKPIRWFISCLHKKSPQDPEHSSGDLPKTTDYQQTMLKRLEAFPRSSGPESTSGML